MARRPEGGLGRLGVPKKESVTPVNTEDIVYFEPGTAPGDKPVPKFQTMGTEDTAWQAAQKRRAVIKPETAATVRARQAGEINIKPLPRGEQTTNEGPTLEDRDRAYAPSDEVYNPAESPAELERTAQLAQSAQKGVRRERAEEAQTEAALYEARQKAWEEAQQAEIDQILAESKARAGKKAAAKPEEKRA